MYKCLEESQKSHRRVIKSHKVVPGRLWKARDLAEEAVATSDVEYGRVVLMRVEG